ncbi:MAG: hypothetical protein ACU843_09315 [Gammaproteobacteria bacterium]
MIAFTDLSGLFSGVLLGTSLASYTIPVKRLPRSGRLLLLGLLSGAVSIPFGTVAAAAYIRGFVGDLSIPALVLMLCLLISRVFDLNLIAPAQLDRFCLLMAPLALVFYPSAMGLGKFDPYALGYGSLVLLGSVFLVTLLAFATGQLFIAISLSLSVFCYALGWYESNNLWDYLIDPLLAVFAATGTMLRFLPRAGCGRNPPIETAHKQ